MDSHTPIADGEGDRVQVSVTFQVDTLAKLSDAFPEALDNSERVRTAVAQSLERADADRYTMQRNV